MLFLSPQETLASVSPQCWHMCCPLSPPFFPPFRPLCGLWYYVGWGWLKHVWHWGAMKKGNSGPCEFFKIHSTLPNTVAVRILALCNFHFTFEHQWALPSGIPPSSPHQILSSSLDLNKLVIFSRWTDMVGVLSAIIKRVLSKLGKITPFGKEAFSEYTTVSTYVKADYLLLF